METLKPNFSEVAGDLCKSQVKLINQIKTAFNTALPEGYMIVNDEVSFKVGLTTNFNLKDHRGSSVISANCELMHVWHGVTSLGISMQKNITAIDIYKLSEVMQIMVGVDLKILGNFEVVK